MRLKDYDLPKLNSLTKYPSILTYHAMGGSGRLTEQATPLQGGLFASEKVDGTNARIIFCGDDYLIGSREELLTARGDRIPNPQLDIVTTVLPIAERLVRRNENHTSPPIVVIYGEVYGAGINTKTYGAGRGFRVFDVAVFDDFEQFGVYHALLQQGREEIARWRDGGNTPFLSVSALTSFCDYYELSLVPQVWIGQAETVPTSLEGAYDWMAGLLPLSQALLDAGAPGVPEGLVLRSATRRQIVKLRFQDYERAINQKRR